MKNSFIKILIIMFCLILPITYCGCAEEFDLSCYVIELRSDVFEGQTENYHVKAGYGFKDEKETLTLKLIGKYDQNVTYTAKLNYDGVEYKQIFTYSPVSSNLTTSFQIDNFNLKTFQVTVLAGSSSEVVNLTSSLPENTLDYKKALKYLQVHQPDLINSYFDNDGNFTASIIARVIVKNDHPYWYVGLKKDNLKALLVDGFNGEILAVREVF